MLFVGARLAPRALMRSNASSLISQMRHLSASTTRHTIATPALAQAAATASSKTTKPQKAPSATSAKKKTTTKKAGASPPTTVKGRQEEAAKNLKKRAKWVKTDAEGNPLPLPNQSKPTRPTAYVLYMTSRFADYNEKEGFTVTKKDGTRGVAAHSVVKAIGAEWAAMTPEQKKVWHDKQAEAIDKYNAELEQWKSSLTKEEVVRQNAYNRYQRNLGRKKLRYSPLRDPRRPKKPMSGFFLYLSEGRAKGEHKQEGQKMRDWIAKQGANWKALSEEEQRPYVDRAKLTFEQWKRDVAEYENR